MRQSNMPFLIDRSRRQQPTSLSELASLSRQAPAQLAPINMPDMSQGRSAPVDPRIQQAKDAERIASDYAGLEMMERMGEGAKDGWNTEQERQRFMFRNMVRSKNPTLVQQGFDGLSELNKERGKTVKEDRSAAYKYAKDRYPGKEGTPEFYSAMDAYIAKPSAFEKDSNKMLSAKDYGEWLVRDKGTGQMRPPRVDEARTKGELMTLDGITPYTATEGEKKSKAEFGGTEVLLEQFIPMLESGDLNVSGMQGLIDQLRSDASPLGVLLDYGMNYSGNPLEKKNIVANSMMTAISNQAIAAIRGAAVGPEEQKMFERQLPMPGQPLEVQKANAKLTYDTIKNLRLLREGKMTVEEINKKIRDQSSQSGNVLPSDFASWD